MISSDAFFVGRSEQLATLALRHAVPTIFQYREFTAGLMSYGGNITDAIRLAGVYAGRILKDEKPADLPVQQATKVELFLNPQDRQGARAHCSKLAARPRRRGDRATHPPVGVTR